VQCDKKNLNAGAVGVAAGGGRAQGKAGKAAEWQRGGRKWQVASQVSPIDKQQQQQQQQQQQWRRQQQQQQWRRQQLQQ